MLLPSISVLVHWDWAATQQIRVVPVAMLLSALSEPGHRPCTPQQPGQRGACHGTGLNRNEPAETGTTSGGALRWRGQAAAPGSFRWAPVLCQPALGSPHHLPLLLVSIGLLALPRARQSCNRVYQRNECAITPCSPLCPTPGWIYLPVQPPSGVGAKLAACLRLSASVTRWPESSHGTRGQEASAQSMPSEQTSCRLLPSCLGAGREGLAALRKMLGCGTCM